MPVEGVAEVVVEEDLRGASSVAEGAEVGGADTFAPSPGKFTCAMAAANGPIRIVCKHSPSKHGGMM